MISPRNLDELAALLPACRQAGRQAYQSHFRWHRVAATLPPARGVFGRQLRTWDCTTGPDGYVSGWGEKLDLALCMARNGDTLIVRPGAFEEAHRRAEEFGLRVNLEIDR